MLIIDHNKILYIDDNIDDDDTEVTTISLFLFKKQTTQTLTGLVSTTSVQKNNKNNKWK